MEWLIAFSVGVASGAIALYIPWLHPEFKKYVLPCSNANCPHHGPDLKKRIAERNEEERRKPPRE